MRVVGVPFPGWLDLKVDYEELEQVKRIPIRRFDSLRKVWSVPDTGRVRAYLGKLGVDTNVEAPSFTTKLPPIVFKTTPRAHQVDDLNMMDGKHAFGVLDEPGMGKTKVGIDDATRWYYGGKIDAVIVVCPNSITGNWCDEIDTHSAVTSDKFVYDAARKKASEAWVKAPADAVGIRWFIMAAESIFTKSALEIASQFAKTHRCILIVDESTYCGEPTTDRTKNIIKLAKLCPVRRIFTGTMLTKSLEKAWSQFEILDPRILDMDFYPFRGYFCVMGGYKMKQIVASKNDQEFFDIIAPWVCLKKKVDYLDLPPKVFQVRKVAPSKEQRALYSDILSGVVQDPSFSVAMVRDLRLHQVSGGFTYRMDTQASMDFLLREMEALQNGTELPDPDELDVHYISEPIPGPNPKVQECLGIAEQVPGKIIFWFRYRSEIEALSVALRSAYGDSSVVEFHGGIDKDARQPIIRAFQNDPEVRYFLGQIHTGGIGITLTAASVEVFYSNDWSAERRIQAEDRIHRISQGGESCLYIDLVLGDDATPAGGYIDSRVLRAVQQGKDYHAFVQDEIQARLSDDKKLLIPADDLSIY
jgi:SNF2 family DNA or RNA helicase